MPLYESTFVIRPDLTRQQVTKLTEDLSAILSSMGGKIVKEEYWGLRALAYKINKNSKGHYMFLVLDATSAAVDELQRNARLSEDIMRHLVVRVDSFDENPSPVLQRGSRDDFAGAYA